MLPAPSAAAGRINFEEDGARWGWEAELQQNPPAVRKHSLQLNITIFS